MIEPKEGTQHFAILDYLRTGKSLTGLDALRICGTMKLASRVSELRRMGHNIQSETIETDNGKHISKYWLSDEPARTELEEITARENLERETQKNVEFFERDKQLSFLAA